jgi:hypothetical protein
VNDDVVREERAIYALLVVVLAPVPISAIVQRAEFGGGATLCLIGAALGVLGLLASLRALRRPGLPAACAIVRQPAHDHARSKDRVRRDAARTERRRCG